MKKFFKFVINSLHFVQIVLIFLSFFVILYWLFQLGEATFIQVFAPFFEGIKDYVHLFYTRRVSIDQVTIDFSFLIAAFTFLAVVLALRLLIEQIHTLEGKFDIMHFAAKQKREELFNLGLKQESLMDIRKNNKYLVLINFSASSLIKNNLFNSDAGEGVDEKRHDVLLDFVTNIENKAECEKKFLNDGILLYFKNINTIDNTLLLVEDIISVLKYKYQEQHWHISYFIAVDVYAQQKDVLLKLRGLINLIRLNLKDKIVCVSEFRERYVMLNHQKFRVVGEGVYKITGQSEDVYIIKS